MQASKRALAYIYNTRWTRFLHARTRAHIRGLRPWQPLAAWLSLILLFAPACQNWPPTAATPARPTLGAPSTVPLEQPVSAGAVAVDSAGRYLAAANPDSDSVTLVSLDTLAVRAEIAVGDDPRTVAFTPDGARLLAANHGAGTLTVIEVALASVTGEVVVGPLPYGVVAGAANAYISLAAPPRVARLDLTTWQVTAQVPLPSFPAGLALAAGEERLYITHLYSGAVSVLDPLSLAVQSIPAPTPEANLAQFIALSPDGARAYAPQTDARSERLDLAYHTTVRPMVSVLDLAAGTADPDQRLDLATLDRPVNLPFAAAVSPDGARLYIANAGSNDVTVLGLAAGQTLAHLETGRHPRGLALAPDGRRLFVNNVLDGTLDVFDTTTFTRQQTVTLTALLLPEPVLTGKRLFNSALAPMSRDNWISCATCHLDGGADGRTWAGFPDGPRNTPALFGAAATLPLHWNGNLDELHDTEHTIRDIQGGVGLILGEPYPALGSANAGRSAAMDALAAYAATLAPPPSPYAAGLDAQTLLRGERAFRRWGCAVCHLTPAFTDLQTHSSGIGDPAQERRQSAPLPRFDTPSLLGVWATAPYFHDGSAATLRDTFFNTGFHNMGPAMNAQEVEDLVAYMRALPPQRPD
ncbi:MAG: beta-propeller fold lactonase family protein [Anaerolineales bacterium]|nr:beta-propeller fold lactonase family protein [Anaerolineales bacterium]